jgi:hypothetical protein
MVDFAKLLNQPPKPPPIVPQLVIAITGHRPHKLASPGTVTAAKPNGDGYEWGNPLRIALRERIREETERLLARQREGIQMACTVRYYEQSCNRAVRIDPREVLL